MKKTKVTVRTRNYFKYILVRLPWLSSLVSPFPEFDPSKKLILVKGLPKGTCPRKSCEIQGGGLNLTTTVKRLSNMDRLFSTVYCRIKVLDFDEELIFSERFSALISFENV